MKEAYIQAQFRPKTLELIDVMDDIVEEYAADGYLLTVRQIYYQLVARDIVPNTVTSYDNVQSTLNRARLAGLIDWDSIEDRTRDILERQHWNDGGEILAACANSYHEDLWDIQGNRIIVIVEKEALAGVLERMCRQWDCPLLPARGYPSATILRQIAKERIMHANQEIIALHLGDHDPSGMDMSRDLLERLEMFSRHRASMEFRRIALNMDQIRIQKPPPNPAKTTDARYKWYREQYGEESWELDALKPQYISQLVEKEVISFLDMEKWEQRKEEVQAVKDKLKELSNDFEV